MTNLEATRTAPAVAPRLHLISVGPFGKAVAGYLAGFFKDVQQTECAGSEDFDQNASSTCDMTVLAAWRPVPVLCELLDDLSHRHARPFIPLIVDSAALHLGPIVVPGKSGCWHCWQARSEQHAKSQQERSAALQFYQAHPHIGPAGYLEPFAMIGAAKIALAIQSLHSLEPAGHIWHMDLFTKQVSVGYLIGVDGCPRCGLGRPTADRTHVEMRKELAFLWSDGESPQVGTGTNRENERP